MVEPLERVELNIDRSGQLILPKELQEKLEPGIAFIVETRHNGVIALRIERLPNSSLVREEITSQPELIDKQGVLVVSGEVSPQFDWNLLLEDREAPLHG